jgi:DNA-binding transcriptional LysR family regulator
MSLLTPAARYFEAVAEEGSIRRAADRVHVAASAVNRQILALEESIKSPLFERLPRGVKLTPAGRVMLDAIRRMSSCADEAAAELGMLSGLKQGRVVIGGLQLITDRMLPETLHRLRLQHPGICFRCNVASTDAIVQGLFEGHLEIGLCWDVPAAKGLSRLLSIPVTLGLAAAPGHSLIGRRSLEPGDLHGFDLILPGPGMELRAYLDRMFAREKFKAVPAIETNSAALMRQLAILGTGVLLTHRFAVREETRTGQLVVRSFTDKERRVGALALFVKDRAHMSAAVQVTAEALSATLRNMAENR